MCFEEQFDTRGKIDSCQHLFCFACIETWSKQSNTCPLCKRRFKEIVAFDVKSGKRGKRVAVKRADMNTLPPGFSFGFPPGFGAHMPPPPPPGLGVPFGLPMPMGFPFVSHHEMLAQQVEQLFNMMNQSGAAPGIFLPMMAPGSLAAALMMHHGHGGHHHHMDEDEDEDEDDDEYDEEAEFDEYDEEEEEDYYDEDFEDAMLAHMVPMDIMGHVALPEYFESDEDESDEDLETGHWGVRFLSTHPPARRVVGPGSSRDNPVVLDDDADEVVDPQVAAAVRAAVSSSSSSSSAAAAPNRRSRGAVAAAAAASSSSSSGAAAAENARKRHRAS